MIIRYILANRRYKQFQKTVELLGGEEETPPTLLAQRDMCRYEKEYYAIKLLNFFISAGLFAMVTFVLVKLLG